MVLKSNGESVDNLSLYALLYGLETCLLTEQRLAFHEDYADLSSVFYFSRKFYLTFKDYLYR